MIRILHCHSTFSLGGKEARAVRLMNAFGDAARHTVLSAVPEEFGARDAIEKGVAVDFPSGAPSLTGKPSVQRYRTLAQYMRRFDLILTYNWGALDAVMARRIFAKELPPLVHHEDGFNADESVRLKIERTWFRRIAFPAAHAVVVPSRTLEDVARKIWKQPARRVRRIGNGIDVTRYGPPTATIPGLTEKRGEIVIGTVAGLRAVKNLPRLVRAVRDIPNAKLVIAGEGPARQAILGEAARLGMAHRIVMPGFMPQPHRWIGHFDIFALSSDSEQFPIAVVEAMAAGLPVASTDVGDIAAMVSPENRPFVGDDLAAALLKLAGSRDMRASIGAANQTKAIAEFDERTMIHVYAALYENALNWPGALSEK